ncbi:penicillin-binding transpeptidase domain-containing protein, partial [Bittarella massiliensis (ex Durand et al. 2017)]|nr:BlaR1 family beta-lactam sensor/signal transducer [Bittarella massiliensis (ex Durand et al. 2017)]
ISPLEQVELLTGFYHNEWNLHPEYVKAVKNAICLASSSDGSLYGKTGTGQVNGENRNGWFIGFVESSGHTV